MPSPLPTPLSRGLPARAPPSHSGHFMMSEASLIQEPVAICRCHEDCLHRAQVYEASSEAWITISVQIAMTNRPASHEPCQKLRHRLQLLHAFPIAQCPCTPLPSSLLRLSPPGLLFLFPFCFFRCFPLGVLDLKIADCLWWQSWAIRRLSLRLPDGSLSPQAFSPTPQPNPAAAAAAETLSLLNRDHEASLQMIWQQPRPEGDSMTAARLKRSSHEGLNV